MGSFKEVILIVGEGEKEGMLALDEFMIPRFSIDPYDKLSSALWCVFKFEKTIRSGKLLGVRDSLLNSSRLVFIFRALVNGAKTLVLLS